MEATRQLPADLGQRSRKSQRKCAKMPFSMEIVAEISTNRNQYYRTLTQVQDPTLLKPKRKEESKRVLSVTRTVNAYFFLWTMRRIADLKSSFSRIDPRLPSTHQTWASIRVSPMCRSTRPQRTIFTPISRHLQSNLHLSQAIRLANSTQLSKSRPRILWYNQRGPWMEIWIWMVGCRKLVRTITSRAKIELWLSQLHLQQVKILTEGHKLQNISPMHNHL